MKRLLVSPVQFIISQTNNCNSTKDPLLETPTCLKDPHSGTSKVGVPEGGGEAGWGKGWTVAADAVWPNTCLQ